MTDSRFKVGDLVAFAGTASPDESERFGKVFKVVRADPPGVWIPHPRWHYDVMRPTGRLAAPDPGFFGNSFCERKLHKAWEFDLRPAREDDEPFPQLPELGLVAERNAKAYLDHFSRGASASA
jgi:hypothetical protein